LLDSYAGMSQIRFNGTHFFSCDAIAKGAMNDRDLSLFTGAPSSIRVGKCCQNEPVNNHEDHHENQHSNIIDNSDQSHTLGVELANPKITAVYGC
jgi:hypothetical protein